MCQGKEIGCMLIRCMMIGCRGCLTLRISTRALDSDGVMARTRLGRTDSNSADFSSLMAAAMTCRAFSRTCG